MYPFTLRKPGAHHNARFMGSALYFLKAHLFSNIFDMSTVELDGVKKMAVFICLFYTEAFLKSRLPISSPSNDLKFLAAMNLYEKENKSFAKIVKKSVSNHLWYLTQELVILAIFDQNLPPSLRQNMVVKLCGFTRPIKFAPGKPKFPDINPDKIDYPQQLITLIGPRIWLLFHLLELKAEKLDWMQCPVEYWSKMEGYKRLETTVSAFECVNDCAERGVKLVTDYKDVCTDVTDQEALFQIVEKYRNSKALIIKQK